MGLVHLSVNFFYRNLQEKRPHIDKHKAKFKIRAVTATQFSMHRNGSSGDSAATGGFWRA